MFSLPTLSNQKALMLHFFLVKKSLPEIIGNRFHPDTDKKILLITQFLSWIGIKLRTPLLIFRVTDQGTNAGLSKFQ